MRQDQHPSRARLHEHKGSDAQAGQVALRGAWAAGDVADRQGGEDEGSTERPADDEAVEAAREAATRCRRLAIACFEADRKRGLTFADDEATADALLADLHRRVGDFDAARACARTGRAREPEGLLLEVLRFQVRLAESGDADCHHLGEIEEDDEFTIILPG